MATLADLDASIQQLAAAVNGLIEKAHAADTAAQVAAVDGLTQQIDAALALPADIPAEPV